jgi:hypothetical protein
MGPAEGKGMGSIMNLNEKLRREIDDAIEQIYKQWTAGAIFTAPPGDVGKLAEYLYSQEPILAILSETGIPGETKKPWHNLTPDERMKALMLRYIERTFEGHASAGPAKSH